MFLAISFAGGVASIASAQGLSGDPALGRELAMRRCSACHDLQPQDSQRTRKASDFQAMASRRGNTAISLRSYLRLKHEPELMLGAGATDDIVAYILSLNNSGAVPGLGAR